MITCAKELLWSLIRQTFTGIRQSPGVPKVAGEITSKEFRWRLQSRRPLGQFGEILIGIMTSQTSLALRVTPAVVPAGEPEQFFKRPRANTRDGHKDLARSKGRRCSPQDRFAPTVFGRRPGRDASVDRPRRTYVTRRMDCATRVFCRDNLVATAGE